MITGTGNSVFSGVAIGKIYLHQKKAAAVHKTASGTPEEELVRFHHAKQIAADQLKVLFKKTSTEVGEEEAMILDVQLMMLEDGDYNDAITQRITVERQSAACAVDQAGKQFADFFAAMEDDYMRARASDVKDISQRLIAALNGEENIFVPMEQPMIVVADDLTPSETVQFEKDKILAFVTRQGSANSHAAILARMMNIPSIVGASIELDWSLDGKLMIVDGLTGSFYIEPDKQTLQDMQAKQQAYLAQKQSLETLKGKESITQNGQRVHIYANIGSADDLSSVLANDAEGIGLFRSEFLYLGRDSFPTEEEQFEAYRTVLSGMDGKRVIIRTLDIGADKKADYFRLDEEENPALGYRAIRICLCQPDIFKTQLRAIYRASAFGRAAVMFPMIISVEEVKSAKRLVQEVQSELTAQGIAFGEVELGVMIETPAAVMISDLLAKEVDFFSVGTNDLTQYTLAIDRQNRKLEQFYNPHHPALLQMLKMVAENAHANGIWAGICGELAADFSLTEQFLQMGYDELSVSPVFVLELRKKVREINLTQP